MEDPEHAIKGARNIIQEMLDVAKRSSADFQETHYKIDFLEQLCTFSGLSPGTPEQKWALGEYGIVKTIAVLQTAVKEFIRDLVNFKEARGEKLPERTKRRYPWRCFAFLKTKRSRWDSSHPTRSY
jgi:hypothetical protein